MKEYKNTPVNDLRNLIKDGFGKLDDANDVAYAIISSAGEQNPPLRVAIEAVAKTNLEAGLKDV